MENYYDIYERPHLQEFLDYLFKNFNVSVWTAASKDYAMFIVNKIIVPANKPGRKLQHVFFSYHCDLSKKKSGSSKLLKNLSDHFILKQYSTNNTIIIDDYYEDVYKCQESNCIIAQPFEFTKKDSENDTFLKDLIPKLERLKNEDVVHSIVIDINGKTGEVAPPQPKPTRFSPKQNRKLLTA